MSLKKVAIETKEVGEKMSIVKVKTEKKDQEETVIGEKIETLKELKEFGENGGKQMNTQKRNPKENQDEKASLFESVSDIREEAKSQFE